MFCSAPAAVTVTAEINGYLAHWPTCLQHIKAAGWRVRAAHDRNAQVAAVTRTTTRRPPAPRRLLPCEEAVLRIWEKQDADVRRPPAVIDADP